MRQAVARDVALAVEREDALQKERELQCKQIEELQAEYQQLLEELKVLQAQGASQQKEKAALEEAVSAAQAAQHSLQQENAALKLELETNRSAMLTMQAQLTALNVLHRVRCKKHNSSRLIDGSKDTDSFAFAQSSTLSHDQQLFAEPHEQQCRETTGLGLPHDQEISEVQVPAAAVRCNSSPVHSCRNLGFAQRDSVQKTKARLPWRTEFAATFAYWKKSDQAIQAQQHAHIDTDCWTKAKKPMDSAAKSLVQRADLATSNEICIASGGG